jgi:hypothetical protein
MVKLSISNLNSKGAHRSRPFSLSCQPLIARPSVGKPVKPANVESLALRNKQIDEIEVSFAVFKQLRQLDLSQNRLRFVRQLENALSAPLLEELDLTANPIAKELADFRLYIIAHTANTLLLLNGEPVSELERCRAWLAFPDCDPIKNKALQASLARPITDDVLQAYAAAGRAIVDEHAASAAALVEKELAAEREAVERRAQVLADRESIEQERKAEAARRAAALAEHERLLAEAREADRKTAVDSGLIAPAPATPSVAAAPKPAAPAVAVAVATPSIDDIFGNSAVAAAVPKAVAPTPSAAGNASGLWWTDAPIGGVLSAVEGVDDAPLDLASVAERARARAAERKQQEAATLAKLQAIQAAKEESERVASLASDEARRERELAEKARQEALAREQMAKEDAKRREAAELAARRAHEEQERARAEQRRRDEEAAQRERERVAKARADAEREKAARAAHEATERMRREAEESRLRDTAAAAAAVTSSGTIFEESPDELRKAVERQERQLEALRNAGAHLVALDKAEEKLEKARRRLAAGGATAVAAGESPTAPVRVIKSLDTRLSVATATGKAASIFDDVLDDAATRKSKAAAAKTKSAMDDLFGAI